MVDQLLRLALKLPLVVPRVVIGTGVKLTLRGVAAADALAHQLRPSQTTTPAPDQTTQTPPTTTTQARPSPVAPVPEPVTIVEEELVAVLEPERDDLGTAPQEAPEEAPGAAPEAAVEAAPEPEPPVPAADELAIPDIDHITVASVRSRLRRLDHEQLHQLRAYEAAHGHRAPVLTAIDNRLAKLDAAPQSS